MDGKLLTAVLVTVLCTGIIMLAALVVSWRHERQSEKLHAEFRDATQFKHPEVDDEPESTEEAP